MSGETGKRDRSETAQGTGAVVREVDRARDKAALRRLFIELHEFERALDPRMRAAEEIADAYLAKMFERCEIWDGVVLVAENGAGVVGFVCVWRRVVSPELDDIPEPYAYVSDLVVSSSHRGSGTGRSLLRAAEARSHAAGVATLRLSVLAGNVGALALYEREGFAPVELELEKRLRVSWDRASGAIGRSTSAGAAHTACSHARAAKPWPEAHDLIR